MFLIYIKGHINFPPYLGSPINKENWSKSYINWVDQTRVTQCGIKNSKIDTFYDFLQENTKRNNQLVKIT